MRLGSKSHPLAILAAFLVLAANVSAQEPRAWTLYIGRDLSDETGFPVSPPNTEHTETTARSNIWLVHNGDAGWGRPIPLDLHGKGVLPVAKLAISDTLGFFAIQGDSAWGDKWTERLVGGTRFHSSPYVAISDTLGRLEWLPYPCTEPKWAPSLAVLALSRLRVPWVPAQPTPIVYPVVPDSVIVMAFQPRSRQSFPISTRTIAWLGSSDLIVGFAGTLAYKLSLPEGRISEPPIDRPGAIPSPTGEYAHEYLDGHRFTIWSRFRGPATTDEVVRPLGKGDAEVMGQPFWVRHPQNGGLLCFGILWHDRLDHTSNRKPDPKACEVIVYDAAKRKVTKRMPGGFLGAAAGRQGAFFIRSGRILYEPLAEVGE